MNKIILHGNSKYNTQNYTGYCVMCLEKAAFRHVLFNGINSIICTRCNTAKPLHKGLDEVPYMYFNRPLSFNDKCNRFLLRLHKFCTGTWNRTRFSFKILKGK